MKPYPYLVLPFILSGLVRCGDGGDSGSASDLAQDETPDTRPGDLADCMEDPTVDIPADEGLEQDTPDASEDPAVDSADLGDDPVEDLGAEEEVTQTPSGWHTRGQRIIDPEGRQVILHGFNLSNDVKLPPYDSWAHEEDYRRLRDWGVSTLRLLTAWASIMPERGTIDESYLERYDQRIEWAGQNGILIIMDMHQDVFGEGFGFNGAPRWACDESLYEAFERREPWYANYMSPQVKECYGRFWTDTDLQDLFIEAVVSLASRHESDDHVIGIDLYNEPYWGPEITGQAFVQEHLQPFYERVLTELDRLPKRYLFFFEPPTTVQWGIDPGFAPFDFDNLVYAPHYYHPTIETRYEYPGDPAPMQFAFDSYQETAEDLDVPWLLGEWGGFTISANYEQYMRDMMALLESFSASDTYYDYTQSDGGYSPLNADGSEKPQVVNVFVRVYPRAVGGELIEYHFDDLSRRFSMVLETLEQVTAPTVLAFPRDRLYPGGFVIASSDAEGTWSWEIDEAGTQLSFTIDRSVGRHTISIEPLEP